MVDYMSLEEQVDADFGRARRKAVLGRLRSRLRGDTTSGRLSCFEDVREQLGAAGGVRLGLRTVRSGGSDPQQRISKRGDEMLRKLLVQCAHYVLGPFAPDSGLRPHGEKLAQRGGKNARRRAVVAVARKLSVLLRRLWTTGEAYEPLYNAGGASSEPA